MGKNLIQQARGKGSHTYKAPSFKYRAEVKYTNKYSNGIVVDFVKCRGHSAPLAQIKFEDGEIGYNIAAEGIKVGDVVTIGEDAKPTSGNTLLLRNIPIGTSVFNIESKPGDGGKFVRSSGTLAKIVSHNDNKVTIILPSKKKKEFNYNCRASIGIVSGGGKKEKPFLKAGTKFHYMKARNKLYPITNAIAMNAVDHPFGTSRSSKKGRPDIARKNAPPGAKVGKIRPRRTGVRK